MGSLVIRDCDILGDWLSLDAWLDSFSRHYRLSHKLTVENVMQLAEQLQMPLQLPRSPENGTVAVRDESPLFQHAAPGTGVEMTLTLEGLSVQEPSSDNPFMSAGNSAPVKPEEAAEAEDALVAVPVPDTDKANVNPFLQTRTASTGDVTLEAE